MKKKILVFFAALVIVSINSCKQKNENTSLEQKFNSSKTIAKHRSKELFGVFNTKLSKEETKYLKFLYAYMPLSDLADYSGEFYLKHVKATIKAKNEMDWASSIPERVFKHFVLPHRVNNENLDTARNVFFNELKNRIKGMSMYDAAIEVNHWCHEKVEYRPADGRTSSPLATMKTAFGRCGEESTFAVAAMRSVCIPARQVYTPRWAHCDDNHAWVEVWADGQWYFLGACEPEPVLNLGWFNESASRAMLVHARAYGEYRGSEEINVTTSQYNDINVVERYAKTFKQFVEITDAKGNSVDNAKVEYKLYNYAEFYPITTKISNKKGMSHLTTGFGELLIWASKGNNYGFEKVKIGEKDTVSIVMSNPGFKNVDWELKPPASSNKLKVELSGQQINENKARLQYEDSVRNAYVSGFISKQDYLKSHNKKGFWKYVKAARGNYNEIIGFITKNKESKWTKPLLELIAEKDLRDTKATILNDHLNNSLDYAENYSHEIFTQYILNPRIDLEMLLAYKQFLINKFNRVEAESFKSDPNKLIKWIKDSIEINNNAQAYNLPITPIGVYNLRVADSRSRNIFFVAACRSFGIPSRLEQGTKVPQYFYDNKWVDVFFDCKPKQYQRFKVNFKVEAKNLKYTPQYYHHFTLAKFEINHFKTLELGEYQDVDKIGELHLIAGNYRLITSNRLTSGKILVDMKFFKITNDTVIGLSFPEKKVKLKVKGSIDRKKLSDFINYKDQRAKHLQEKSNIVIAIIQPDKEPSKHVLNDIQKIKKDFEILNNTIVFLIQKNDLPATFKAKDYPDLPYRTIFKIIDKNPFDLFNIKIDGETQSFPKVIIANPKGEVIYYSEGYKIGIGNDILKLL
ncbi:MAG: transglutaminase domain-containing protein [Bacteroidales bacterium]|nr:transglutaminase domain-containing protein [Bacteroidales bacterium]